MPAATRKSVSLSDLDKPQMQAVARILRRGAPSLTDSTGERIDMPKAVIELLRKAVEFMTHGQAVTIVPENKAITTQRAADILGMSRPFFIKLLESGAMHHHRVGSQRRVYLRDVLAYASHRDQKRTAALNQLARDAYEAGLYEHNMMPPGGTGE